MKVTNGVTVGPTAPLSNFATTAAAVTPSDSVPLPDLPRALYVGTSGALTVIMAGDATQTPVTFAAVPAGSQLPIAVSYVMATGTTAGNIGALY